MTLLYWLPETYFVIAAIVAGLDIYFHPRTRYSKRINEDEPSDVVSLVVGVFWPISLIAWVFVQIISATYWTTTTMRGLNVKLPIERTVPERDPEIIRLSSTIVPPGSEPGPYT